MNIFQAHTPHKQATNTIFKLKESGLPVKQYTIRKWQKYNSRYNHNFTFYDRIATEIAKWLSLTNVFNAILFEKIVLQRNCDYPSLSLIQNVTKKFRPFGCKILCKENGTKNYDRKLNPKSIAKEMTPKIANEISIANQLQRFFI